MEAETLLEKQLDLAEQRTSESDEQWADLLVQLGSAKHGLGKYPEADKLFREALRMREALPGDNELKVADIKYWIGIAASRQRKHPEAEQMLRDVVEIRERILGPNHPDVGGRLWNSCVCLAVRAGRIEEAVEMALKELRIVRQVLPKTHIHRIRALANLERVSHQLQSRYSKLALICWKPTRSVKSYRMSMPWWQFHMPFG